MTIHISSEYHRSRITDHGPLALIGANGMLASMIRRVAPPNDEILPFDLPEFDLTDRDRVLRTMAAARPGVIINCAAFTNVDGCESQEELATRVNGDGPGYLAEAARECGAVLVHISTDYVFDGRKETPYTEEDKPNPLSAYGRSKLRGEEAILRSGLERYFILRTSWLYGPGGKNFVETIARLAGEREELRIVADQFGTPTYTEDLATAIFNLLKCRDGYCRDENCRDERDDVTGTAATMSRPSRCLNTPHERHASRVTRHGLYGLYHFSNASHCSWHQFAEEIVARLRRLGAAVRAERVLPIGTEDYPLPAARPAYSVFSKEKYQRVTGAIVPNWQVGLGRYFDLRTTL